jgi:uncharacterized membrane protein (DUF2068 family)
LTFDQWPAWRRALTLNTLAVAGISISLATGAKLSPKYNVPVVVFTLALLNFLFLGVRPRIVAARAIGASPIDALGATANVVRERPLVMVLVILQVIGVSRAARTVVTLIQVANGDYVRGLPNASSAASRLVATSGLMAAVAAVWLLSAVGLWGNKRWAWWLAFVLNSLAASVSGLLQLTNLHSYLFDAVSTVAVVLLLLPIVRQRFRGSPRLDRAASSSTP